MTRLKLNSKLPTQKNRSSRRLLRWPPRFIRLTRPGDPHSAARTLVKMNGSFRDFSIPAGASDDPIIAPATDHIIVQSIRPAPADEDVPAQVSEDGIPVPARIPDENV